ncbi:MAG: adenylate/guanylate cyclase domain-containing protein [Betaproteobacteria bacterium]
MEPGTSTSPIKRRLTAILAADAVGYSRHMSVDEERTLKLLAAQRSIIDRIIVSHSGRIISTAGDSVLAEFASSVEAVRCAIEIQEALETRNSGLPESERLVFRIGVNLGDVMVDGADILGDGVNVASRLEGIADPGGVCISSSVYDQIAGKLSLGFVDIGEKSLKNIARPIRVYRFDRGGEAAIATRATSRSRNRWVGIAGAVVVGLAAAAAWKVGLFERAAAPPTVAAPASAPASAPAPAPQPTAQVRPEAASEETKLKLQIAEAERARAEAELARSRADAEAAKQRAAAAASERKSVAPAATAPVPAPTAAPSPAAKASAPAAPAPAAPSTVAAVAPAQAVAPAPSQAGAGATGVATRSCEAWEEVKPMSDTVPARMENGEIVVERGEPGKPGYLRASGRPAPDGHLVLAGSFFTLLARLNFKEYPVRFEGGYSNGLYTLHGRMGTRGCTVIVRFDKSP